MDTKQLLKERMIQIKKKIWFNADIVATNKRRFMNHRKREHGWTVALCRKNIAGECPFSEDACWWNHDQREKNSSEIINCFICGLTLKKWNDDSQENHILQSSLSFLWLRKPKLRRKGNLKLMVIIQFYLWKYLSGKWKFVAVWLSREWLGRQIKCIFPSDGFSSEFHQLDLIRLLEGLL